MGKKRFTIQGFRDYRAVQLPDIIQDLKIQKDDLKQVIEELDSLKIEIENKSDRLNDPNGVLDCIEYMSSLFDDTLKELARLVDDLPRGVKDKHILMAKEIHKNCLSELKVGCRSFKEEYICRDLKDESMRELLDRIHSLYRDTVFSLLILNDIGVRFEALLGDELGDEKERLRKEDLPVLEIPEGTQWKDIKLRFLDHEELQIIIRYKSFAVKSYKALGFMDGRTASHLNIKSKPNRLWRTLALLASVSGEISWQNTDFSESKKLIKNLSDLRALLKNVFLINDDPIKYQKKGNKSGYKTVFNIDPIDRDLFNKIKDFIG